MIKSKAANFLTEHRCDITDGVRNVDSLVDYLLQKDVISKEMASTIRAKKTKQNQMRELYDHLNSKEAYKSMLDWMKENEPHLIKRLESKNEDDDETPSAPSSKRPKLEDDHYNPEMNITGRGAYRGRAYRGRVYMGARGAYRGARGAYRGARGASRGRAYRGTIETLRGGPSQWREATFSHEDSEVARIEESHKAMRDEAQKFLQNLTLEEFKELGSILLERQPGLVFDILKMHQDRRGSPLPEVKPDLLWCKCGNCRKMPQKIEEKCCEQEPESCISMLAHFSHFCLDDGYLSLLKQDSTGQAPEPGDEHSEYRAAAYRQFIAWRYGPLGRGNREVIPSCCVWRIRDKYPDPNGEYTGFSPNPKKYNIRQTSLRKIKPLSFDFE